MVRVFTTYFAKLRKLDNNLVPIAIVRYSPKWYDGKLYQTLVPKAETLLDYKYYSDGDWKKFKREYLEQLERLDPEEVLNDLETMSRGKDVVLVCFEKDNTHCHRSLCAKWLIDNLGICARELQI